MAGNTGGRNAVTAGYAVEYYANGYEGQPFSFTDATTKECAEVVVPYDAQLFGQPGHAIPEDALRVVRITTDAERATGAPAYIPIEFASHIDPLHGTVSFCSEHLSNYVVIAPPAPPMGAVALAYVINNGTRATGDQSLSLVDLDSMKPAGAQFDIALPTTPRDPSNELVLAYAHILRFLPGAAVTDPTSGVVTNRPPMLAAAYRRLENASGMSREVDVVLFVDMSARQVVGSLSFAPPSTAIAYFSRVRDFAVSADGSTLFVAVDSSEDGYSGLYRIALSSTGFETSTTVISDPPLLAARFGGYAALGVLDQAVVMRAESRSWDDPWAPYFGPVDASMLESRLAAAVSSNATVPTFAPYIGFDYRTVARIRSLTSDVCLSLDSDLNLIDHTWACVCVAWSATTNECVQESCGPALTGGLNSSSWRNANGDALSCTLEEQILGHGLASMMPVRMDPGGGPSASYDLVSLMMAAGQVLSVDTSDQPANRSERVSTITNASLLESWNTLTFDKLSFFHPSSTFVVTPDSVWSTRTTQQTSLSSGNPDGSWVGKIDALEATGHIHPPHIEIVRYKRVGDTVSTADRYFCVDCDLPGEHHVGRSGVAVDSTGRGIVVLPGGEIVVVKYLPKAVEKLVAGTLPLPPNKLDTVFDSSLTRASVSVLGQDIGVTLISAVAHEAAGDATPESLLLMLTDYGTLTTERFLSTSRDGIQLEGYGAAPTSPVAPLGDSTRQLQSRFATMSPLLFDESGKAAPMFDPLPTPNAAGHTIAVVPRGPDGALLSAGGLSSGDAVRVYLVEDSYLDDANALGAVEASELPAPVAVRRYLPQPESIMLVASGATGLALYHWDHQERDPVTSTLLDVYAPGAPPRLPEVTLDAGCGLSTSAGVVAAFCLHGIDLAAWSQGDGERIFAADVVAFSGTASATQAQRSPVSGALDFALDRTPPHASGQLTFASRVKLELDFDELIDPASDFSLHDARGSVVPATPQLVTRVGDSGPVSRLAIVPSSELAERAWYYVDPSGIHDRAGNPLVATPLSAWRTRTRLYEELVAFSARTSLGDGSDVAAAIEDTLADAGTVWTPPLPQADLSLPLMDATASLGDERQGVAALLAARAFQFYDPDGLVYDETDVSPPAFVLGVGSLERIATSQPGSVTFAAVPRALQFDQAAIRPLLCTWGFADCFISEFLPYYDRLRGQNLVHVDRTAFVRLLAKYAAKLVGESSNGGGPQGLLAAASLPCGEDPINCAVEQMQGLARGPAAAMGLFAKGWLLGLGGADDQAIARQCMDYMSVGNLSVVEITPTGWNFMPHGSAVPDSGLHETSTVSWTTADSRRQAKVTSRTPVGPLSFEDVNAAASFFTTSGGVHLGVASGLVHLQLTDLLQPNHDVLIGGDTIGNFGTPSKGSRLALLNLMNVPYQGASGESSISFTIPKGLGVTDFTFDWQWFSRSDEPEHGNYDTYHCYTDYTVVRVAGIDLASVKNAERATSISAHTVSECATCTGMTYVETCDNAVATSLFSPCTDWLPFITFWDEPYVGLTRPHFEYSSSGKFTGSAKDDQEVQIALKESGTIGRNDPGWAYGCDRVLAIDNIQFTTSDGQQVGEGGVIKVEGDGSISLAGIDWAGPIDAVRVVHYDDGPEFVAVDASKPHKAFALAQDVSAHPIEASSEVWMCGAHMGSGSYTPLRDASEPPCGCCAEESAQAEPVPGTALWQAAIGPAAGQTERVYWAVLKQPDGSWRATGTINVVYDATPPFGAFMSSLPMAHRAGVPVSPQVILRPPIETS